MTTYIVDATDQATETMLLDYQATRSGVQRTVGQMYQAIRQAEAVYKALEAELGENGRLAPLEAYHAAKQAPVSAYVATLRSKMAEVCSLMESMQSAMPVGTELFPGVPRTE